MQKNKIPSCLENLCFVDSTNEAKISRSSHVILFSVIISYYHGTLLTYCHRSVAVSLKTLHSLVQWRSAGAGAGTGVPVPGNANTPI